VILADATDWIRGHVEPNGPIELVRERPWATIVRVPRAGGVAWLKACAPAFAFEARLTAELFARWPDRVSEVLAIDEKRAWILLADAGTPMSELGNPPDAWLRVLPGYAELQRGEVAHAADHVVHGVTDLRVAALPARYDDLLRHELPIEHDEVARLRRNASRFAELCAELAGHDIPETVQHDDLHARNLYLGAGQLRVLDWGDASIAHPFTSLVVTFRFLEETNGLSPGDPWFARLRDAYLEPWGTGHVETFDLALRVGAFAHAIAWARQRDVLPADARAGFDTGFATILRRALAHTVEVRRGAAR
jgi:hypothetical protein